MKSLAILALLVFSLGGYPDLLGVGPGAAAGRILYPNGTQVGFILYENGSVALYPWYAVIDASRAAAVLVDLHTARVVYACRGVYMDAGNYTKTPPPLSLAADGEALIAGGRMVACNGTVYAVPGASVVDAGYGVVLAQRGRDTLILTRGEALVYSGVSPVTVCNSTSVMVSMRGSIGVLDVETGVLTLYEVKGFQPGWGDTLDYSVAYCDSSVIAVTGVYMGRKSVAVITRDSCKIYTLRGYPSTVGVAGDDGRLYLGFASPPPLNATVIDCEYSVEKVNMVPSRATARLEKLARLPTLHPLHPSRLEARETSPQLTDNIVLMVIGAPRTGESNQTSQAQPHYAILAAGGGAAAIGAWMLRRRMRVGGVRSSSH